MTSTVAHIFKEHRQGNKMSPTVLVVEDFDDTRFMLRVMLEVNGYHVIEASDGLQAVEVAQSERPDLILMDMNLPQLDGFAATRRIREQIELRKMPIVAVTAYGTSEYRSKAIAAGCDEFITKPINFAKLKEMLSHLLVNLKAVA